MLKLETTKLINPEFIQDDSNFLELMKVHENDEYQAVSSAKESECGFLLIHTRYTKNNKRQENEKNSNCH